MKENNIIEKNIELLKQYVPIVAKVHGNQHPEFLEVKNIFYIINEKILNNNTSLNIEFEKLRVITNNYAMPNDVCESYEAVYSMLKELDQIYMSKKW